MSFRVCARLWFLAALVLAACSDEPEPREEKLPEIALEAVPRPGTYKAYWVDVTVSAPAGVSLYFGINEDPEVAPAKAFPGVVKLRLVQSGSVRVVAQDQAGRTVGPVAFEYELRPPANRGACQVYNLSRPHAPFGQTVDVDVSYVHPNMLSRTELLVDGEVIATVSETGKPVGIVTAPVGPFYSEGLKSIECRVVWSNQEEWGNKLTLLIDGTPPTAAWESAQGPYTEGDWTGNFILAAADLGAGLATVQVCDAARLHCMAMESLGDSRYRFATAVTAASGDLGALYPYVVDGAGNVATAPALNIDPPYASAATRQALLLPITFTTAPTWNLRAALTAADPASGWLSEVWSADLQTLHADPAALPLAAGWNDFVFKTDVLKEWHSFAIYRLGLSAQLPPSDYGWLVFASNATVPAFQMALTASVPASPLPTDWARQWFDVPHLVFVEDRDANAAWTEGDQVYLLPGEPNGSPWLAQLAPVAGAVSLHPQVTAAGTQSMDLICETCDAPGVLVFQRRTSLYAYPSSIETRPDVAFTAAATTFTGVTLAAELGDTCVLYWDEDGDGALGGREPRAMGPCANPELRLAREGTLQASVQGATLVVAGAPYGGRVTAVVSVYAGSTLVHQPAAAHLYDTDGTGRLSRALAPFPWPVVYDIAAPGGAVEIAVPAASGAGPTWAVRVSDQTGAPVAAAVGVYGTAHGGVYDPANGDLLVVKPGAVNPELIAYRDGYLSSFAAPATQGATVLRLHAGGAATPATGTVVDANGDPVEFTVVRWHAWPYFSQTRSAADGSFALPISGTGTLQAVFPGAEGRVTELALSADTDVVTGLVLAHPGPGVREPAGLLGSYVVSQLRGAYTTAPNVFPPYYAAEVTTGTWSVEGGGLIRDFVMPGGLPVLGMGMATDFQVPVADAVAARLSMSLRCGARRQSLDIYTPARTDSACWSWLAVDELGQTYFLGVVSPSRGGADMRPGLQLVTGAGLLSLGGQEIVFRDMVLGRKIRARVNLSGAIAAVVPHGRYRVETAAGVQLLNNGAPALVEINYLPPPALWLSAP